jgi:general secretion pathway protein F
MESSRKLHGIVFPFIGALVFSVLVVLPCLYWKIPGIILVSVLLLVYGLGYLAYYFDRQNEFLHFLIGALESDTPLSSALREYIDTRPPSYAADIWFGTLLCYILPGYWFWHQKNNYDRKIARLADLIDRGLSLREALKLSPGFVSKRTLRAIEAGETTDQVDYFLLQNVQKGLRQHQVFLWIAAPILGILASLVFIVALCFLFAVLGFLVFLLLLLVYGWLLYAFFNYRYGRQDEFLQFLIVTIESGLPLAPTLKAFVRDRPRSLWREFWVGLFLLFVLPGYYWLWYRKHNFDQKILRLANLIQEGFLLSEGLKLTPGLVSSLTLLAVTVGETTGQPGLCLRRSVQERHVPLWAVVVPRLLYPVVLVVVMGFIFSFWMIFLLPKMKRIFLDFNLRFPEVTEYLVATGDFLSNYLWLLLLMFLGISTLGSWVVLSPTFRWYFPGLGRLYRMNIRGGVLKMLGVLLDLGKPAPEAVAVLAGAGGLPGVAQQDLARAGFALSQGESLAESLHRGKVLAGSAVPLVKAAEAAQNVPWALGELGEQQTSRAYRLAYRISLVVFPTAVVAVGVLVGFLVLGFFLPLIELLSQLA